MRGLLESLRSVAFYGWLFISHPAPINADNSSGSFAAACINWRIGDADSMSARTKAESTLDAGYTTAGASQTARTSVSFLRFWGSPYKEGLDLTAFTFDENVASNIPNHVCCRCINSAANDAT